MKKFLYRGTTIFEENGKFFMQRGVSKSKYGTLARAKKAVDRFLDKHKLGR